jgi:hypothetical protein
MTGTMIVCSMIVLVVLIICATILAAMWLDNHR